MRTYLLTAAITAMPTPDFSKLPDTVPDTTEWVQFGGDGMLTMRSPKAFDTGLGQALLFYGICEKKAPCEFHIKWSFWFEYPNGRDKDPRGIVSQYIMWRDDKRVEAYCSVEFGNEPYHYSVRRENQWDELSPGSPEWQLQDLFFPGLLDFDQEWRRMQEEEQSKPSPVRPAPKQRAGVFMATC